MTTKPHVVSKDDFIARLRELYGDAITQEVIDDISPCLCRNDFCLGWRGDPDLIIGNMMKLEQGETI